MYGDFHVKDIRRPLGRLIFNMGIAIPGKTVFLIETAPRLSVDKKQCSIWHQNYSWRGIRKYTKQFIFQQRVYVFNEGYTTSNNWHIVIQMF